MKLRNTKIETLRNTSGLYIESGWANDTGVLVELHRSSNIQHLCRRGWLGTAGTGNRNCPALFVCSSSPICL